MKIKLLITAELIDAFRIVPRLLIGAYGWLLWIVIEWFMQLTVPTMQQAILVSTITGASAAVFGLYTNSGRSWDGQPKKIVEYKIKPHSRPSRVDNDFDGSEWSDDFRSDDFRN